MGGDGRADGPGWPSVAALLRRHATGLRRSGPYRPPDDAAVACVPALVAALASGTAAPLPGLSATELDGRLVLAPPRPGAAPWVLAVATPGVVARVLVEVPHPYADLYTEVAGPALAARVPGALLLQAGAHRVAAGPGGGVRDRAAYPADVAARPDALFSRIADGLVARLGVPQVQWHGFADRDGVDVVASSGAAPAGPLLAAVTAALSARGLRVLGPADPRVADLAGRRNVQGLAAAAHGAPFLHVELSRSVRDDPARLDAAVDAVAVALRDPS